MEYGDFTGLVEAGAVMAELKDLFGGRVWETSVPDDVELARAPDGKVKPYCIVRFGSPFASSQGRSIALPEQDQPHVFTFSVLVISGNADWTRSGMAEVNRALVGKRLSANSTPVKATGGFSYGTKEAGSTPSRAELASFYRTFLQA